MLAACAAPQVSPPPAAPLGFVPQAGGIGVPGSALEVGFGRSEAGARAALAKLAGPETGAQACLSGGSRVTYRDGLAAVFSGGRFLGWETATARAGAGCS